MGLSAKDILTPLQRDFLEQFFRQTDDFFLTGGTALAAFYLFHRRSEDLDLFTTSDDAFASVLAMLDEAARASGAHWTALETAPAFRRFMVERGDEGILVDCVRDIATQIVPEKRCFEPFIVDSLEDITCNKICALLGRVEMKDYIDVYFLHKRGVDIKAHIELAKRKDAGLSEATLAYVLSQVSFQRVPASMIEPVSVDELQSFFQQLCDELAQGCFPGKG